MRNIRRPVVFLEQMKLRTRSLICAAVFALGMSAAGLAAAAAAPASATLAACHDDPAQSARYATFAARMVQLPGATQMAARFTLYERAPGGAMTQITAPGFGVWQTAAPGVGIYRANEVVTALPAPLALRVVVDFRWSSASHRTLRRAQAVSATCTIRLLQPDLQVASVVHRGAGGIYRVVVRNDGSAPAGPFAVELALGGVPLPAEQVPALAVGARVTLVFRGPRCSAGETITATADSGAALAEPRDGARTASAVCAG